VEKSRGFIYMVSLVGITGARDNLPVGLNDFVQRIRKKTDKPLCVGFGISSPEQAHQVAGIADGVIIGSRLIQLIKNDSPPYKTVRTFISEVRAALDQ
jgi:tryptophan synthase alpha chain